MSRAVRRSLAAIAKLGEIPAPVGGWNARDALSAMEPDEAVILENWLPGTGGCSIRPGSSPFLSGGAAAVQSLFQHSAPSGTKTLFAAAGTAIYNATAGGTSFPAASVSTLTNAKWQDVMFATTGGNFLVIANGADSVRNYSGSAWSTPSITGVTSSTLINVTSHQSRLWFCQVDTLKAWYLPSSAISGAANELDIGPFCKLGGSLLAIASWTRDGGAGMDDVAVFITTAGEAVVYSGTDPASASTWTKVGTFRIPEPIGRRCVVKAGADVAIVTSQGVLPLSTILPLAAGQQKREAVTDKIGPAFIAAYKAGGTLFGWQVIEYPKGEILIVNVPTGTGTTSQQFVVNTRTGAWCKFKDLNALCWSLLGDVIYFGTNGGKVVKYDVANMDDTSSIVATMLPAFQDFGAAGKKQFVMARPLIYAATGTSPPLTLRTDYDTSVASLTTTSIPTVGPAWNSIAWNTTAWGPSPASIAEWQSLQGIGQVGTVYLSVSTKTPLTLNKIDVMYQPGGVL